MSARVPPPGVVRGELSGFPLAAGKNRFGSLVVTDVNILGEAWFMGSWNKMTKLGEPIPDDRLAFVGWVVDGTQ